MTEEVRKSMRDIWLSMATQVELRDIGEPIDWLPFEDEKILDDEFVIREMRDKPKEFEAVAEVFRTGFPVVRGTEFEALFSAQSYPFLLGSEENFNKGDKRILVVEYLSTGKIAAVIILGIWKKQRNGEFVAIALHEDFQKNGIGRKLHEAGDRYFEKCGVEMAFVWLATEHTITQRFCLEGGFTIRGIIPGWYRIWAGDDKCRRTVQVFAQKFYGGTEKMCPTDFKLVPEIENLVVPW